MHRVLVHLSDYGGKLAILWELTSNFLSECKVWALRQEPQRTLIPGGFFKWLLPSTYWEGSLRTPAWGKNISYSSSPTPNPQMKDQRLALTDRHPGSTWPVTASQALWWVSERSCRQLVLLRSSVLVKAHWRELSHYLNVSGLVSS